MKNKKIKRFIPLFIIGGIVLASGITYGSLYLANKNCRKELVKYIDTFDKITYENQLIPYKDSATGFYTFKTDNDIKIMQLTDIHLGGGCYSKLQDKKTIYEVMTMVQHEKPDLVILDGDNIFCCPGPIFNGGGTFNNKETSEVVIHMFEHLGVYFTSVFGNHDTEAFDYTNRVKMGQLYQGDYKYSIFESNFTDSNNKNQSVTNQCIVLKNNSDEITKALLLIDSNDYESDSLSDSINWRYDTIHNDQTDWALETIQTLSDMKGDIVKSLAFFHIPVGEYETAYRDLKQNNFANTANSKYISGIWGEELSDTINGRIWYGGCQNTDKAPEDNDLFFEKLGPDGYESLEGCFCGHDHANNAVVEYKGVTLAYGYSLDNLAYSDLMYSGTQRGCTIITVENNGTWSQVHKNAYNDCGVSTNKFVDVYLDHYYYKDDYEPKF